MGVSDSKWPRSNAMNKPLVLGSTNDSWLLQQVWTARVQRATSSPKSLKQAKNGSVRMKHFKQKHLMVHIKLFHVIIISVN